MGKNETLASDFNKSITLNTDIYPSYILPTKLPALLAIYCTFDTAGVLSLRRKFLATTVTEKLNSGNNLSSNSAYMFEVFVDSGESVNLQYSATATALSLKIISEDMD